MSLSAIIGVGGVVLIVLGIVGGGFTGQLGLPRLLTQRERILSLIGGAFLIVLAYSLDPSRNTPPATSPPTIVAEITPIPSTVTISPSATSTFTPSPIPLSTETPTPELRDTATATLEMPAPSSTPSHTPITAPTVIPPTLTNTSSPPSATTPPSLPVSETCQRVQRNLPQTRDAIIAKFGLASIEILNFINDGDETCKTLVTGFVYKGTEITVMVPNGGCVDSYQGAGFSHPDKIVAGRTFDGLRATAGTVTATHITYREAWCEKHP